MVVTRNNIKRTIKNHLNRNYIMKKTIKTTMVLITFLSIASCEHDEIIPQQTNEPFLSLPISQSQEEKFRCDEVMEEANRRVKPYLKFTDKHIELTLSSGKAINVSEEIYDMFVTGIQTNNELLEKGEAYIYEEKVYEYTAFHNNLLRVKRGMPEGYPDDRYDVDHERLPGNGSKKTIVCENNNEAFACYLDNKENKTPLPAILLYASKGVDGILNSKDAETYKDAYETIIWNPGKNEESLYKATRNGGIKIVTIDYESENMRFSNTYIYDKNDKLLGKY